MIRRWCDAGSVKKSGFVTLALKDGNGMLSLMSSLSLTDKA